MGSHVSVSFPSYQYLSACECTIRSVQVEDMVHRAALLVMKNKILIMLSRKTMICQSMQKMSS